MDALRLVPDWKDAWRWLSMHAMGWSAALLLTWTQLPPALQAAMPAWLTDAVVVAVLLLGMVGRLIDQRAPPLPPPTAPSPTASSSTSGDTP